MVTDRANINIAIKYEVAYQLLVSIWHMTLAYSEGQGHGCCDWEYLSDKANITIAIKYEVSYDLW